MKAVTIRQPWASLIILGLKRYETRSWRAHHRGPLAIHAASAFGAREREVYQRCAELLPAQQQLPLGMVLGTVKLHDCFDTSELHPEPPESELGDFSPGRFAWLLLDPLPFDRPVPAKGALMLWEWTRVRPPRR